MYFTRLGIVGIFHSLQTCSIPVSGLATLGNVVRCCKLETSLGDSNGCVGT